MFDSGIIKLVSISIIELSYALYHTGPTWTQYSPANDVNTLQKKWTSDIAVRKRLQTPAIQAIGLEQVQARLQTDSEDGYLLPAIEEEYNLQRNISLARLSTQQGQDDQNIKNFVNKTVSQQSLEQKQNL